MRFTPGQSVGRYIIESPLGEGGMGEVYRARDSKLERAVALKVLRKDTNSPSDEGERAARRMQREAQAVAALSHPGIISIYDIGEQEEMPFIAMELVEGQSLRALIGQDLPFDTRVRILLDVAKALGAAHDAGFVHRDIKPENILVRHDGAVKILDFGIARKMPRLGTWSEGKPELIENASAQFENRSKPALQSPSPNMMVGVSAMTADGALIGTPAYMSPEQLQGETADARADQFAWSVVAYEFFSGKHPFQRDSRITQVIAAILRDSPEPLVDLPPELNAAIMRGLEKERDKRWASMQELVNHCDAFATNADTRKFATAPVPRANGLPVEPAASAAQKSRHWQKSWLMIPIVVTIILTIFLISLGNDSQPLTRPAPTVVSSVTRVTELPVPASTNTTAIAEFRQGMQNIRDARWGAAAVAFQRALTADPEMAAAHLRYAIVQYSTNVGSSREAYRKAFGLRMSMSERDQGFLHAHEPLLLRDPPDWVEATRRMEKLSAQYPGDLEIVYWCGQTLFESSTDPLSMRRSEQVFDRCTELDPQYADCWQAKSKALLALGNQDESLKALDECIKRSEISADCILDKIQIESRLGHCDIVIDLAQQLRAKEPVAPRGSRILTQSLYNRGEPETVVRNAYSEVKERMKTIGLFFESETIDVSVAVDYGEFSKAIEKASEIHRAGPYPTVETEYTHYWMRAELLLEINEIEQAAQLGEEFVAARPLRGKSTSKRQVDVTMLMQALRLKGGKISENEYRQLRMEWLDAQPGNTESERARNWLAAYALPARSVEFAREAIDVMPRPLALKSLDQGRYSKLFATFQARLFALAEKHEEALPMLEEAARSCTWDNISLWQTQNYAMLGKSREATGDIPGACRAYQLVLSRWGISKESRTANEVRRRFLQSGC